MATHSDVEYGIAVAVIFQSAVGGECFGNKWCERKAVGAVFDAEENTLCHGDIAGKTPQHVGRVEFSGDVTVVEIEIFLVRGKQSCRAEYCPYRFECALFVAGFGIGHCPVGTDPGPQGIVVIGWNVGNLREEYGRAERCGGIGGCDSPGTFFVGYTIKYGKRFAESFRTRIEYKVIASVSVHGVIAFFWHPQHTVDGVDDSL